jgi:hypothetical protein
MIACCGKTHGKRGENLETRIEVVELSKVVREM